TLAVPDVRTIARFQPIPEAQIVSVFPPDYSLSARAARRMLEHLGYPEAGGLLSVEHIYPVLPGRGNGWSTMNCAAPMLAVADSFRERIAPEVLARLCVEVEGASDPTMFYRPVIFASRQGKVIDVYPNRFPALEVLTLDTVPVQHPGIRTLSFNPRYSDRE